VRVKAVSCEEPKGNASDTAQCPSGYRYVAGARRYFGSGISVTKSVRLLRGCMDRLRVVSVVVGVVTVLDKYCRNGRSTLDSECRAMRRGLRLCRLLARERTRTSYLFASAYILSN